MGIHFYLRVKNKPKKYLEIFMSSSSSSWSTKDKLIGVVLLLTLLAGAAGIVYAHVNALRGPGIGIRSDDPDCLPMMGVITDKYEISGRSKSYKLEYRYRPIGEAQMEQIETVDFNTYFLNETGDSVEVCYLRDQPHRSMIMGNDYGAESIFYLILLDGGILLALVFLIRSAIRQQKKHREQAAKTTSP